MDKVRLQYLYERYLNKTLNDSERLEWKTALAKSESSDLLFELTESLWERNDIPVPNYNKDNANTIYKDVVRLPVHNPKSNKLWLQLSISAVLFICIFGAGLFSYYTNTNTTVQQQDMAPGGDKATLTLSDGKRISLSDLADGRVAGEPGISITKVSNGQIVYNLTDDHQDHTSAVQFNTIQTPRGGQYQIHLPDGTIVWLNAASSFRFPISFSSSKQREVELSGEGYFQVVKDKKRPFIVKTQGQQVQVLGTHFNISAYNGDAFTKTTLVEGSVKVISSSGSKLLSPGHQAIFDGHDLNISVINTDDEIAWKDGYFRFNSESIENIMKKLSRWYNIEVTFEGNVKSKLFTGKISKYKNLQQVLNMLSKTKVLQFNIEGRRVIVSD